MEFLSYIISLLALLMILSGFYFLFRIHLCSNYVYKGRLPKATIIIPARNEEQNIGRLLGSIKKQGIDGLEVIVVNDSSTDKTGEIALDKGARVIDSRPLPLGWNGKPWACWQGAEAASTDIFIFLDSDTELEQGGLRKIIETYAAGDGVMSIAPYHKVEKFYEDFSAVFNIIMMGSMNAFTPNRKAMPHGLFGQVLVISKEQYYAVDGHRSVKDKVLENMFMAGKLRSQGIPLRCFGGFRSISFRMYPEGLSSLMKGWSKAFASGAAEIPFLSLLNIILWISGGITAAIMLIFSIINGFAYYLWSFIYILFCLQFLWMIKRIGSFRAITAFLFPIHLLFFCIVFSRSLYYRIFKVKPEWKSREVTA